MFHDAFRPFSFAVALAVAIPLQAQAVTIVADGSTVTRNAPSDGTDAIQLDNGSNARINTGGSAINTGVVPGRDGIFGRNDSTVTVSGGTVRGRDANYGGNGVALRGGVFDFVSGNISGGTGSIEGGDGMQISDAGEFSMTGGTLSGGFGTNDGGFGVTAFGTTTSVITGGSIIGGMNAMGEQNYSLWTDSMAEMVLRGGAFSGDFLVSGNSTLTIFGSGLAFDRGTRVLTGTLQNGDVLDLLLFKAPDAFLNLIEVPVTPTVPLPASALLLLGGLGLFGAARFRIR